MKPLSREEVIEQQTARQLLLKRKILRQQRKWTARTISAADVSWCFVPVDSVGVDDLDSTSFDVFRSMTSFWMSIDMLKMTYLTKQEVLRHLLLLVKGRLRRAAVLLFHNDPGSIFPGFGVSLIQSRKDIALLEDDTLFGSLVSITTHLTFLASRRYTYNFAGMWARRAVFNAFVNNNYASGRPIEIFFGDDEISVRSSCILPDGWTPDVLLQSYMAEPFNPEIALAFCSGGFYFPEYDLLKKHDFGVPECTVQSDVLTVSLAVAPKAAPKDDEEDEDDCDDEYDENDEEDEEEYNADDDEDEGEEKDGEG